MKSASPNVGIMHDLKSEFQQIFERSKDLGTGTLALVDWLKKAEPYYRKSVPTIQRFPL
ncbi:MAG TPA: ISL3 family transposase, partial [Cyanobacteria bacterium UBA9226]|nr:ISL3 family transposase [Cyanobacteria bacterium UBA9226]